MPYGGSCGRRIDVGLREGGCGDQGEEGCGPKRASAAPGDLEDALAAMIELWRSGQVGASTPAIYGLSSGCATILLWRAQHRRRRRLMDEQVRKELEQWRKKISWHKAASFSRVYTKAQNNRLMGQPLAPQ